MLGLQHPLRWKLGRLFGSKREESDFAAATSLQYELVASCGTNLLTSFRWRPPVQVADGHDERVAAMCNIKALALLPRVRACMGVCVCVWMHVFVHVAWHMGSVAGLVWFAWSSDHGSAIDGASAAWCVCDPNSARGSSMKAKKTRTVVTVKPPHSFASA